MMRDCDGQNLISWIIIKIDHNCLPSNSRIIVTFFSFLCHFWPIQELTHYAWVHKKTHARNIHTAEYRYNEIMIIIASYDVTNCRDSKSSASPPKEDYGKKNERLFSLPVYQEVEFGIYNYQFTFTKVSEYTKVKTVKGFKKTAQLYYLNRVLWQVGILLVCLSKRWDIVCCLEKDLVETKDVNDILNNIHRICCLCVSSHVKSDRGN